MAIQNVPHFSGQVNMSSLSALTFEQRHILTQVPYRTRNTKMICVAKSEQCGCCSKMPAENILDVNSSKYLQNIVAFYHSTDGLSKMVALKLLFMNTTELEESAKKETVILH